MVISDKNAMTRLTGLLIPNHSIAMPMNGYPSYFNNSEIFMLLNLMLLILNNIYINTIIQIISIIWL